LVTIDDVARMAEVSKSTVSKVINNYSGVSSKTRERVLKAMKECNYWPNATARSLTTSRSGIVGLFVASQLNDRFFREVLDGLETSLGEKAYDILYLSSRRADNTGSRFGFVEKARDRHVDGVIFLSYLKTEIQGFDEILGSDIPVVFVDVDLVGKRASYVMSDNLKSGSLAAEYLVRMGHRAIGLIDGRHYSKPAQDRLTGFQKTLAEYEVPYNPDWVFRGEFSEEAGYHAMQEILSMSRRPTAIVAQDLMAIGAIKALRDAGLSVPEDMSIVGFDDIELSRHYDLTTVRQKKDVMGREAGELILRIIRGEVFSPVTVDTEFVERGSCRRLA
jgi:LacI family transcriptional regulator